VFADDYPRFIEVSELTPELQPEDQRQRNRSALEQRNRMNERYEALFVSNRDIFEGARVLDLASHDGRFSMAALKTGAAHVTGVEVRQSLVDKAQETFEFYGRDPETYRFVCGDLFEVLSREKFDVDVVLCLGYLYHTWRYTELMYRLHNLAPRHLILDTMVIPDTEPTLKLVREPNAEDIRSAAQDAWSVDRVLVLRPSVPALQMLVRNYGFEVESLHDWKSQLAGRLPMPGLDGYATGKRVTLRCRSRQAAIAAGWEPVAPLRFATNREPTPPPPPAQPADGWRGRVNKTLAKATGYELHRASTKS
jgi:cyclopropane fatty-acyl-phospholipid synthase-like methyltransferase